MEEDDEIVEILPASWSWRLTLGNFLIFPTKAAEGFAEFLESVRMQVYSSHIAYRDKVKKQSAADEARQLLSALDEL